MGASSPRATSAELGAAELHHTESGMFFRSCETTLSTGERSWGTCVVLHQVALSGSSPIAEERGWFPGEAPQKVMTFL